MRRYIALDLFAGAGGLTQGLKQAGFRVLGAVEIEPLAVETYRVNHPEVKVWQTDILRLSVPSIKRTLKLQKGDLDLLAGCPPCQGFSSMRTKNGGQEIRDIRNDLVFEFLRFVEELEPKAIMMENVPGLATDERMRVFERRLRKMGYNFETRVLNAADYGVPQRRRRMILLASRVSYIKLASLALTRPTVYSAIHGLPPAGHSGDPLHDLPEQRSQAVIDRIRAIPLDGGSRTALGEDNQLPCHNRLKARNLNGFKDVYGRMGWNDISPTITTGCFNPSKGRFLHPEEHRAITMREAALLQSFPQNYYFSIRRGKTNVAILIGNALPPQFIQRHASKIRQSFRTARRLNR